MYMAFMLDAMSKTAVSNMWPNIGQEVWMQGVVHRKWLFVCPRVDFFLQAEIRLKFLSCLSFNIGQFEIVAVW